DRWRWARRRRYSRRGWRSPPLGGESGPACPRSSRRREPRVPRSSDILHLVEIGAVALGLHPVAMDEPERSRVDAIAHAPAIPRPVVEDVAEVAVAEFRTHLGADHAMRLVGQLLHIGGLDRLREAGPAAPGLVLVRRREEGFTGDDIHVDSGLLVVEERAGSRALGAALLGDAVLLRRQGGNDFGGLPVLRHRRLQSRGTSVATDMARARPRCKEEARTRDAGCTRR